MKKLIKTKIILISVLFISSLYHLKSATCTAIASSNWILPTTWSCGHAPTCNDVIVIPAGYTVTVTTPVDLTGAGCANTTINIYGQLYMSGNVSRLTLVATASVNIFPGGLLHTDITNNSQKITIGTGTAEWDSNMGDLSGPLKIVNNGIVSTLPIELISFTGSCDNGLIGLNWVTASEKNNDYFLIEKSIDGYKWEIVTKMKGAGNSSVLKEYNYSEANTRTDLVYYKLSQIDFDGTKKEFKPIFISCKSENKTDAIVIFPNPAKDEINISYNSSEDYESKIILINSIGNIVLEKNIQFRIGTNLVNMKLDFPSGIYNLHIQNNSSIPVQRIIISNN